MRVFATRYSLPLVSLWLAIREKGVAGEWRNRNLWLYAARRCFGSLYGKMPIHDASLRVSSLVSDGSPCLAH